MFGQQKNSARKKGKENSSNLWAWKEISYSTR
jgi:hypothetical protein